MINEFLKQIYDRFAPESLKDEINNQIKQKD